jgi:hypothetical protein
VNQLFRLGKNDRDPTENLDIGRGFLRIGTDAYLDQITDTATTLDIFINEKFDL